MYENPLDTQIGSSTLEVVSSMHNNYYQTSDYLIKEHKFLTTPMKNMFGRV